MELNIPNLSNNVALIVRENIQHFLLDSGVCFSSNRKKIIYCFHSLKYQERISSLFVLQYLPLHNALRKVNDFVRTFIIHRLS